MGVMAAVNQSRPAFVASFFALATLAIAPSTLSLSCTPMASQRVSLRMNGDQITRDASVSIDDQYIGALAFVTAHGVSLPPGQHRITVEKPGFFPWDQIVDAKDPDEVIRLKVELRPIPD